MPASRFRVARNMHGLLNPSREQHRLPRPTMKVLLVETQKWVAVEDWMADEDGADTFLVSTGSGKSGGLL